MWRFRFAEKFREWRQTRIDSVSHTHVWSLSLRAIVLGIPREKPHAVACIRTGLNVFSAEGFSRGILVAHMHTDEASDEQWKEKLTPEQYRVLREKGTETAFSGAVLHNEEDGVYMCAACGQKLFVSKDKYDSGSGWPSFVRPIDVDTVELREDLSHGMRRAEVVCKKCGGHLGHVFDDGPQTLPDGGQATGRRYCINSLALGFQPEEEKPKG